MKAIRLNAEWAPREGFTLGPKDVDGRLSYLGSKVWRDPRVGIEDVPTTSRCSRPTATSAR